MFRTIPTILLAGSLAVAALPASAAVLTLPFVGDIEHPNMDPFEMMTPATPAAAAPAVKAKKHHRMKKRSMKKKM